MNIDVLNFCNHAIKVLQTTTNKQWGNEFVILRMEFARKFGNRLIPSTWHGIDWFDNVLFCLQGNNVELLGEPKGEYKENFKKMIDVLRK